MKKSNISNKIKFLALLAGLIFILTSIIAKRKKGSSQYDDMLSEKNPLEGKRVVFVEDSNDKQNADGVKGHLKAVCDSNYRETFYGKYVKRAIDIILSFFALIVLFPVFLTISVAIMIDDPGPVLFTQKRIGQNKKFFKLHKFRSMKMSTPPNVPTHQLENPDQYITKVGRFIRAHSLDELPQIWDIFIGNMSIIGPRPGLWNQDVLTAERDKYGANDIKPGLTGWAQINGRDELEIPVKARLDGEYVRKESFLFDAKCFLGSIGVFTGDISVVEGGNSQVNKNKDFNSYTGKEPFSVLMSVYSKENPIFFNLALKSNLDDQTRIPDEFILVCDGPLTDELNAVIEKYQNKYPDIFKLYKIEVNQGLGNALKYGLDKCSNDIVVRSDSDDICSNNRFEIQVGYLETHKNIAVVSSYIDEFDEDWTKPDRTKTLPLTSMELYEFAKFRNPINHMASGFRKHIILKIGSYQHIPYVEDYELWVRTMINGYEIANIDKILVHARTGNGMTKRRGNKEYINSWRILGSYMYKNGMITKIQYYRNQIAIRMFVYMPVSIKELAYKKTLRK